MILSIASSDFDSYQWYNSDGIIDHLIIVILEVNQPGDYYVVATTTDGCSETSDEISLNMINLSAVSVLEVGNVSSTTAGLRLG